MLPKTWPVSPVQIENNVQSAEAIDNQTQTVAKKVDVSIKVKWPSKDTERKLPEGLESLGKMLARGTFKQIAHAAWKNPPIRSELVELMAKEVEKETSHLCSKKEPRKRQQSKSRIGLLYFILCYQQLASARKTATMEQWPWQLQYA